MREHPPEPTAEQIEKRERFKWNDQDCIALWYPQMGGYVGKAVAVRLPTNISPCYDVYVWHDGEFPFDDDRGEVGPRLIHHCDPEQFRIFADHLDEWEGEFPDDEEA